MSAATVQQTPRYHAERPTDLRRPSRSHRLSYIISLLPARLEALATDLDVPRAGSVLDFGCADLPYRRFFSPEVAFVGADLPGNPHASIEIAADGTLPVPSSSFDAVLSTQVLEHVADPEIYLSECLRVLKPGGRLLLSTHGMMLYHPDPVDLWRWTCEGLRKVVEDAGFVVHRFEGIMGMRATALQFLQDGFYHQLPHRLRPIFAACMQTLVAIADRFESRASRDGNALVFALVAEKPVEGI